MKKLSTIILMSLALFLLGCGNTDYRDAEAYDLGYEEGYEKAISESAQHVHDNYTVDEIYFPDEILDYVSENFAIKDVYDTDTLIEYLEGLDYAVIPVEDYNDLAQ